MHKVEIMHEDYVVNVENQHVSNEIIERSPSVAIRVAGLPGEWRTVFVTENVSLFGYTREDLLSGRVTYNDLIYPEDREELLSVLNDFFIMHNDHYTIVYRILQKNGTPLWVSDSSTVVRDENGDMLYTDCILSDYTQTREHLDRLRESYRQQSVLNDILQGIHDSNLERAMQIILDRSGSYLDVSRATLYRHDSVLGRDRVLHQWVNPSFRRATRVTNRSARITRRTRGRSIPHLEETLRRHGYRIIKPGKAKDELSDFFNGDNIITSAIFAVFIQDELFGYIRFDECLKERQWSQDTIAFLHSIARLVPPVIFRQRNESLVRELAITDQLTGLKNRRHLETRLADAITQASRIGLEGYVLFIDMDDFKIINDAYGHDYGDAILREVSAFLRNTFGEDNRVYRFGGDEFVIVVEDEADVEIDGVINQLLRRAQLPWQVMDRNFYCTLSIGVVRFPDGGADSREVLKNADIAMYEAKKSGKNNYVFYTGSFDENTVARAEMENSLRTCIDDGFRGFEVFYQPLTDMNRNLIGAEALVRWTLNGVRLSPAEFIPLAEYLGLIVPLGDFVLASAARCCREVNRLHPNFFISVNASIRQFRCASYLEKTRHILEQSGVDTRNIVLEITEGMAMHDLQSMKTVAETLRQGGTRIAMDDFGTGYSSLGNMRDLPIDVVKIDRMFIRDVTTDPYSESFVRLITDLVHSMRRRVCVEGVETEEQLHFCRECGVDYVQGFHLWRPMPENEFHQLLMRQ